MDTYIVDTSALLKDSDILWKLPCSEIIIHTIVIEELDTLSRKNNSIGATARKICDRLYELRSSGDFKKGIKQKNLSVIKIDDRKPKPETFLRFGFDPGKNDNLLICVAKELQEEKKEGRVILLTGDKFMVLKASLDMDVQLAKRPVRKRKPPNNGYKNFVPIRNNCRR